MVAVLQKVPTFKLNDLHPVPTKRGEEGDGQRLAWCLCRLHTDKVKVTTERRQGRSPCRLVECNSIVCVKVP